MLQCADSATTALSKALLPRRAPARRTGSSRSIVHCRWPQVGAPTSTTTDRVTARRRRRRPDSLPAQGFYVRRPASQRVRVLPQPSPTERTRPTVWRTPFGCPAHTAPSSRPTRVCRQAREPVSICQPRYRPPTPRHETPRHPRVPPTPGATRYRGPLSSANCSPFAPAVEPPPPGLFTDATPTPPTVCARFRFSEQNLVTRVNLTEVRLNHARCRGFRRASDSYITADALDALDTGLVADVELHPGASAAHEVDELLAALDAELGEDAINVSLHRPH